MTLHGPVLGIFLVEAVFGLLLCLPLPAAVVRTLVSVSAKIPEGSGVTITYRCLLVVVSALLLEACVDLAGVEDGAEHAERLYRAQRNIYLTGFTLFLTVMVKRLFSLAVESMRATQDKDLMAKQAKRQAEQAEMVASMLAKEGGAAKATKSPVKEDSRSTEQQQDRAQPSTLSRSVHSLAHCDGRKNGWQLQVRRKRRRL